MDLSWFTLWRIWFNCSNLKSLHRKLSRIRVIQLPLNPYELQRGNIFQINFSFYIFPLIFTFIQLKSMNNKILQTSKILTACANFRGSCHIKPLHIISMSNITFLAKSQQPITFQWNEIISSVGNKHAVIFFGIISFLLFVIIRSITWTNRLLEK